MSAVTEDAVQVLLGSDGPQRRVHAVVDGRALCGRVRAQNLRIVEWGAPGQVTCRACRARLAAQDWGR